MHKWHLRAVIARATREKSFKTASAQIHDFPIHSEAINSVMLQIQKWVSFFLNILSANSKYISPSFRLFTHEFSIKIDSRALDFCMKNSLRKKWLFSFLANLKNLHAISLCQKKYFGPLKTSKIQYCLLDTLYDFLMFPLP